jgi:hypothetical protein
VPSGWCTELGITFQIGSRGTSIGIVCDVTRPTFGPSRSRRTKGFHVDNAAHIPS